MELPKHVAIIMDGNGRWAQRRRRPRVFGHIKGAKIARDIITASAELGIKNLTLFTFSTENWKRPEAEVAFLMRLLERHLQRERARLVKENIRFHVLGEIDRLPEPAKHEIQLTLEATADNSGMNLTFALNYGGRQEIVRAAQAIAQLVGSGEMSPHEISEDIFESFLDGAFLPDPDLIIRTSGEFRLSNFFTWQSAYSEIFVTPTLWPDFKRSDLLAALEDFQRRERRFGSVSQEAETAEQRV